MRTSRQSFAALVAIFFAQVFWLLPTQAAPTHELLTSFDKPDLPPQSPVYGLLALGPDGCYWGTTSSGGMFGYGTIYKVKADGSGWTTVLSFTNNGATNKGASPFAGLVSDGAGYFWGTTYSGGANNYGTVYKINAATGALTTVVEFTSTGATNKGRNPYAGLVSDGEGSFWGTTANGGASDAGTVYRINASTGVLTTVLSFADGVSNKGAIPFAGLLSDGEGYFWGTTSLGGVNGSGTVYKVNATTGALTTVVEFSNNGAANKGRNPRAGLMTDGAGYIWGTTSEGGADNYGTVYKVNASTGALTTVVEFSNNGAINKGANPLAGLVSDGAGYVWGTTREGGVSGRGTVYKINTSTEALTPVVEFSNNGATNKGVNPSAGLVSDGEGSFWGTTSLGGASNYGTVYKINASTGTLTTMGEFSYNGATNKGAAPYGDLVSDGAGYFWGTTFEGGAGNYGTVYKVNASTGALTTVLSFTDNGATNKGAYPRNGLVSDGAGYFWGTTFSGGANGWGTVYKINASTEALTTVVEFSNNGAVNKGAAPRGGLVRDDGGYFWGTTQLGGASNYGTVYKINATTGALSTVVEFSYNGATNKGSDPNGTGLSGTGFGAVSMRRHVHLASLAGEKMVVFRSAFLCARFASLWPVW